jgi:peptidoglycan/xylan/chitin deacetylase (PgdA/CDA1 family)
MNKGLIYTRRVAYFILGIPSILGFMKKPDVTILCYHSINNDGWRFSTKQKDFLKHVGLLEKYYMFISMDDFEKYLKESIKFERPAILLTFDDGYKNITNVAKILKEKNIVPTVFLIGDTKKANREEIENNLPLLSMNEIKKIMNMGWNIGSHTMTHADMLDKKTDITYEIADSKKMIKKTTGKDVYYLAYPKGRYTKKIASLAKKSKYTLAFSMDDDIVSRKTHHYAIPRVGIDGTHTPTEVLMTTQPLSIMFRKFARQQLKINL